MLKLFWHMLMFVFPMFAAASAVGDMGGGEGAGAGDGTGGAGEGEGAGGVDDDLGMGEGEGAGEGEGDENLDLEGEGEGTGEGEGEARRPRSVEDPETAGFKGLVSRRILALKKEAPGLTEIFKEHPKVQEQIEAAFRRDMGYRELGTIADFRSFREEFPGGMADVQQLRSELAETEALDKSFYGRDAQGNYNGHTNLIQNLFNEDRGAAVSLFRTVPKEWARLDPESYNEVMGNIVGATLVRSEIPEWLTELRDAAKVAKQDNLASSLDKLVRWSQGFLKQKAAPTEEERRIQSQREQLNRDTTEREKQDQQRFHGTFVSESRKVQESVVRGHPAVKELLAQKNIPEATKAKIVTEIREKIKAHLASSSAFMKKLRPAYNGGKLDDCIKLQKAQWSYPWILNKFVRAVLAEQAPTMVRQNRERARGAAGSHRQPVNRGREQNQNQNRERPRTEPYKEAGVWYSKEGRRLSTSEILRGAVPDHLLSATK